MKILIIGTGAEIPPPGWGAVEAIIYEHLQRIPKFGVEVDMVNTMDWWNLATLVKEKNTEYDFIHAHYDIMNPFLKAATHDLKSKVAMTSHFPYITNEEMYNNFGYWKVMNYFTDDQHDHLNFCISQRDIEYFKSKDIAEGRLFRLKLGAPESINFTNTPQYTDKTIYLGKICQRKRQEFYGTLDNVDFAGNISDEDVNADVTKLKSYLGEWKKDQVYSEMTQYANLALLSIGENTPLVVREALIAGCGVVVSESSSNELDRSMPFITVIPDDKLGDLSYISSELDKNKQISLSMRSDIREYGIANFGWDSCVKHYISEIERAICQSL